MIEHSGAKVILAQEELKPRLAELAPQGARIVTLEHAWDYATPRAPVGECAPAPAFVQATWPTSFTPQAVRESRKV